MPLWPPDDLAAQKAGDPGFWTDLPVNSQECLVFRWGRASVQDPDPQCESLAGLLIEVGTAGTLLCHGNTHRLMQVAMAVDAAAPDDFGAGDLALARLGPGLALTAHLRGMTKDGKPIATWVLDVVKRPDEPAILDSLLRVAVERPGMERWKCDKCNAHHRASHVSFTP